MLNEIERFGWSVEIFGVCASIIIQMEHKGYNK